MISDFLSITARAGDTFVIELPDIDSDDDEFVICGEAILKKDSLYITMHNNFRHLCEGETYQRKEFVRVLLFNMSMICVPIQDTIIITVNDMMGTYSSLFSDMDDQNYIF